MDGRIDIDISKDGSKIAKGGKVNTWILAIWDIRATYGISEGGKRRKGIGMGKERKG